MPKPRPVHPAALPDDELLAQCGMGHSRTSGPGGQHRNKVATAVDLLHQPTGIGAKAGERRSVRENMPVAIKRLRLSLAVGHRIGVPLGDARSELWKTRVRGGKIVCSTSHRDFPSMLAEALDFLEDSGWDFARASIRLECTKSQLLKLLKEHPPAMVMANRLRSDKGLRPLS